MHETTKNLVEAYDKQKEEKKQKNKYIPYLRIMD